MNFKNLLHLFTFCLLIIPIQTTAQTSSYVKQAVTANSGKFEFSPPYTDYVTVQSYNPKTQIPNTFGTIFTQSAQSILISRNVAFVAAQDSIIKYNLNTFKRISAVADSGLSRLALYNGKLLVSKQYPVSVFFLEVLDSANLGLITRVPGISGDCVGICSLNDTVYLAVNGGWMGTQGKLAIIDPSAWTLKTEVNFGHKAVGIWDLYTYGDNIFTVNKTPYGVIDTGSVTQYMPSNRSFTNIFLPHIVGPASGIKDSLLYLGIDYGIGSFNLTKGSLHNTAVVPDPGSAVFTYIISSAIDTLESRIFINIGDYVTPGYCLVTSLLGDSLTTYSTGISSDAIAIDYQSYPLGLQDNYGKDIQLNLYPNPVRDRLKIHFRNNVCVSSFRVTDVSGRDVIMTRPATSPGTDYEIPVSTLMPGMYYLVIFTDSGVITRPFAVTSL